MQQLRERLANPGTMNEERARWALNALEAYAAETGLDLSPEPEGDGIKTGILDLLTDLFHLADALEIDLNVLIELASDHFDDEIAQPA